MLSVAGTQRQVVLPGRGGDQGVTRPESGGQGILLHINRGPVPDVFTQGLGDKVKILEKGKGELVLPPVPGTLEKLHVGLDGQKTLLIRFHEAGRLFIPSLYPDENVRVKEHGTFLPEALPSAPPQSVPWCAY